MSFKSLTLALSLVLAGCGSHDRADSTSEVQAQDAATTAVSSLKIGEFNMLRLGQNEGKDLDRLADIVKRGDFHLFAGTEVMTEEGAEGVRAALVERTGKPWQLLLSKTASGESSYKEYLAFYYRSDIVKAEEPSESFCQTSEGKQRILSGCFAKDHYTEGYADFDRDPFVGHFKVGQADFALVAAHLYYGGTDAESTERRLGELARFREVMDKVKTSTPTASVVGLGDFNLALPTFEFESLADLDPTLSAESSNAKMPEEFFTAEPTISGFVDGPTTVGFSSYDHILVFDDNAHQPVEGTEKIVTDFTLTSSTQRQKYKAEVSDHYAVGLDFSLSN